ncbi:MAG: porin [Hyphomicrobium sp.]
MAAQHNVRSAGSIVAAVAGLMLATASVAVSADLGGNCCADLEERIAELEATSARKGNRKVSLTISGYVAQEVTWWDDGGESNIYLHGLGPTQASHFKLNGQAQISPGWTAGYMLRIQNLDDNPFGRDAATGNAINQNSDNFSQGLNIQMSYWYIQSKELGKLSVGKQAHAAKSAAMFTDQSGTQVFDNYTFLAGFPQFLLRDSATGALSNVTWGNLSFCYAQALPLGGDCNGIVMSGVRYDTPAFAGFTASASWGEDDFWEVALRYSGEFSGFKVLAGAGYSEFSDEGTTGPSVSPVKNSDVFQVGGYVQHLATGLFLHAAYGMEDNNDTVLNNGATALDSHHWYLKGGIRQKWTALGATIVYGDYVEYDDQLGPAALAAGATSSTLRRYGGGIAQELDAAAMTVYLKYHHITGDVTGAPALSDLEDADFISFGGLINF